MQQSHHLGPMLNEIAGKFSTFCDAVGKIDFSQHSDADFEAFFACTVYGTQRLMKHLNVHLVRKQKGQLRNFIKTNGDNFPALNGIELNGCSDERIAELHHLLLVDTRSLRDKTKILFK